MAVVEKAARIPARKEDIWAMLQSREGQLKLSAGFVEDIQLVGSGAGSRRIMQVGGAWGHGTVEEEITRCDFASGVMEYTIVDTGGIVPFADYVGRLRVIADGPENCLLTIRSTFVPVGMEEAAACALSQGNFDMLVDNMQQAFA